MQLWRSSHSSKELEEELQMARTDLASYSTKETALKSEFQSDLKPVIPSSNTHTQPPGRMTTRSPPGRAHRGEVHSRLRIPTIPRAAGLPGAAGTAPWGSAAAPLRDHSALCRDRSSERRRPSRQRDQEAGVRTPVSTTTTQETRHGDPGSTRRPFQSSQQLARARRPPALSHLAPNRDQPKARGAAWRRPGEGHAAGAGQWRGL